MPRVNPHVEHVERMNKMLREQIERMREDPGDIPFLACDNSCICATARGQATNGGCRCDERQLRRAVAWWRRRAQFLQTTIQEMNQHRNPVALREIPGPHPERSAKGDDWDGDCG